MRTREAGTDHGRDAPDRTGVVGEVETWLQEVVVGLNLCPFAAAPMRDGTVAVVVSEEPGVDEALRDVMRALAELAETPAAEVSTTLIALPAHQDEARFRDVVGGVEALLEQGGLEELFQVVGFHPDAVYEGADPDDPANAAARAPVPVVHLLRADELERILRTHPDADQVADENARKLRELGWEGIPLVVPRTG